MRIFGGLNDSDDDNAVFLVAIDSACLRLIAPPTATVTLAPRASSEATEAFPTCETRTARISPFASYSETATIGPSVTNSKAVSRQLPLSPPVMTILITKMRNLRSNYRSPNCQTRCRTRA